MIPTLLRRRMPSALPGLLCSVLLAAQALAQPAPNHRRPDPLDPKATVPGLRYTSTFAQYRRLGDEQAVSWREANDTVARIGGWRVYTREAQQADPAPAPPPAAKPPAAVPTGAQPADITPRPMPATPGGYSGHSGHKQP